MRIGISYVSQAGAEANLRKEIAPHAAVDDVAAAASRTWDRELDSVRTGGGTEAQRTTFYTALYHSLMQPNLISDTDGRYPGMDGEAHRIERGQGAQYSNFSGWDQYRAQIQLLALLKPEIAGDFAQSLYNFARQNGGVWDRWVHINGATHVMTGDPTAATLATFYAMGVRNFDYEGAYESLARQATVPVDDGLSDMRLPGPVHRSAAQSGPVPGIPLRAAGRLPLLGRRRRDAGGRGRRRRARTLGATARA